MRTGDARALWSGTITFGLVSIPVDLFPASRSTAGGLRMLAPDGVPLRREYYCPRENRPLDRDEIVRGYPLEDGSYVIVSDEELESVAPDKSRDIDLRQFVDRSQLPALALQRSYYLAPSGDSTKAYHLLAATMENNDKAGIATFVMRGTEYVVAIVAEGGVLRAEAMRFADEVRSAEQAGLPEKHSPSRERRRHIERAIEANTRTEPLGEVEEPRAARLRAIATRKYERGEDVVEVAERVDVAAEEGETVDVIQLLKQRLEGNGSPSGEAAGTPAPRREDVDALARRSKRELYERAQELRIEGRSRMSKEELAAAIQRAG